MLPIVIHPVAQIELLPSSIVKTLVFEDAEITKEHIERMHKGIIELTGGNVHSFLIICGLNSTITGDARKLVASKAYAEKKIAMAIVVYNLAQRIVGNFYINFNKPVSPTRLFENEKEALKWLEKKMDSHFNKKVKV